MPKPDAFIEGSETFINYKERLDAHLTAHDVAAAKHTAVLLSSIGAKTYGILRSLTAPDLPSEKSYQELCAILQKHFSPAPLEIVERFVPQTESGPRRDDCRVHRGHKTAVTALQLR